MPLVGSMIVPPGLSRPGPLGGLDHRQADAVLDRTARIEHLELREEERLAFCRSEVAHDPGDPHERGPTDQVKDRLGELHPAEDTVPGRADSALRPDERPPPLPYSSSVSSSPGSGQSAGIGSAAQTVKVASMPSTTRSMPPFSR